MLRVFLCAVLVFACAEGFALKAKLPPYIERCSMSDPNLNECFVRNGNKVISRLVIGDPFYNIPNMKPYKIKEAVVRNDNQIRFKLKNIRVYGLEKARLTGVDVDFNKASLTQNLTIPRLFVLGDYELNGEVLEELMHGKGQANITIVNGLYTSKMKFKNENNHAVPYGTYTYYKPQMVVYNLENLFDGNEFRGYQTNIYLNNNWRAINKLFERGAARYMNDLIHQIYTNIGSIGPLNELYLP